MTDRIRGAIADKSKRAARCATRVTFTNRENADETPFVTYSERTVDDPKAIFAFAVRSLRDYVMRHRIPRGYAADDSVPGKARRQLLYAKRDEIAMQYDVKVEDIRL